jgi:hypothetical protein
VPESDPTRPDKYNRIVPDKTKDPWRRVDDLSRPKQEDNASPQEGELRRDDVHARPEQYADLLRNDRDVKANILGQGVATQDVEAALKLLRDGKNLEGLRLLEDALQKLRAETRGDAAKP